MDFILRNGYIYLVKNEVSPNNKVEGNIITSFVKNPEDKTFSFSVNEGNYKPALGNKVIIETEELNKPYLDLKIKVSGPEGSQVYKTDRLPITLALVLGEKLEDSYTKTINAIFARLLKLEQRVKDLEEVGDLI
jgi:hypothetical protein